MATQKADGSIYIKTEIDTTEAKASVKEIASLLKRLSNQVKTIGKSMEKAMSGGIKAPDTKGMDVVEEKAKTVAEELEKTAQAEKKLESIDIKSNALDTLDKAIESTGQKLAELEKAQMDIFNRNQSATSSPAFQAMESAAAKLDQQYEELLAKKKQLEAPTASTDSGLPKSAKLTGETGLASEESAKALQKLNAEITGTETSVESLNTDLGQTTQLQDEISNSNIKTTAYQILEDSLQRLDTQFEQVATAQQEIFARNQNATSSPAFLALESAAEKLGRQYDELLAKKKQLDSGTTTAQPTEKVRTAPITGNYAKTASEESEKALNALNKEISKTDAKERSLVGTNGKLGSSYTNVGSKVAETNGKLSKTRILATLLSSGISKLGNALKKVGSSVLSVGKRIGSLATSFLNTSQSADNARFSVGRMVGMSILYSTVFGMIGKVNSAVASGMQNLAQYSNRTNAALSSLMSALTRLKNSFATAFSPILTAIAPALVTLINLISKALTYVGMFIAALTGQKTFTKAVGVQQDYAASLGSTASASNDAAKASKKNANATKKANKENQTYLSGLDEIRQFQKKNKDDSDTTPSTGGGGGVGGGGGGLSPSDMFQEVPIASSIKGIADKIRKLIKAEDWEGLGAYIASGINKGLQKIYDAINWNNVGPKITYFVNAFTRTFNSLVDHIDWDLLGRTVGAGINTLVNTMNLLIEGIDWKNLGTKFSVGFRGLVNEVNWTNLGNLLGNKFMIAWNIFNGFVSDMSRKSNLGLTGWEELGTSLGNLVNGIFDKVNFTTIADTLVKGINGAFATLGAFVKTVDWSGIAKNITNGLNAMIQGIDWATAGQTLSDAVTSLLGVFASVAQNTDWNGLGRGIGTFLNNIDWGTIFSQVFTIITNVLGGLISGLASTTAGKLALALGTAIGAINLAGSFSKMLTGKSLLANIILALGKSGGGGIIGTIASGLSTGLVAIFGAEGILATTLIPAIGSFVSMIGTALSGLAALFTFPAGVIVAAIVAGVALIVLNWDKVKAVAGKVAEFAKGAWEKLKSGFDTVASGIGKAGETIKKGWESVKEKAGDLRDGIKERIEKLPENAQTWGQGIVNGLQEKISGGIETVKSTASTLRHGIEDNVSGVVEKFRQFGNDAMSKIRDNLSGQNLSTVKAKAEAVKNSVSDGFKGVISNFGTHASDAMKNVKNTFEEKKQGVVDKVENVRDKMVGGLKKLKSLMAGNSDSPVKEAIRKMKTVFSDMNWGSVGLNVVKGIVQGVGNNAYRLVNKMMDLAKEAWNAVKDFFGIHSPSRLMRDTVGKMIPAGITVGLEKAFPDTIDTLLDQSKQLANVPFTAPYVASGAVIPAKASAVIAQKQHSTDSNNNDVLNLLEQLLSVMKSLESDNSGNNGGDYHFTAQINRRTLFDEFIEEAKLRQMSNGRNPFSLA